MHYGQMVQSHALHFFHLASPDLLLGFDSDLTRRNILGVLADFPEIAKQGVFMRKFGQEVIHHTAGKRIHGTGAIPGGMNKALTQEERDLLRNGVDQIVEWAIGAVRMIEKLHLTNPRFYNRFAEFSTNMMGLVRGDGAMDLYHGGLRATDADKKTIFDHADYSQYDQMLQEGVKPWSYMKFPYIKSLGPEHGWYKVGPLARVQICDFIPSPEAESKRKKMMAIGEGRPVHGTLFYHWARLIKLLHAAEVIRDLLDDPEILGKDLMADKGAWRGEGVGVIEAPRGTLFHHYRVDKDDLVTFCNLIVSTTNNNGDERSDTRRGPAVSGWTRDHGGAAQSYRGGNPCLRPLPVLRDPRPGTNAAGGVVAGRCGSNGVAFVQEQRRLHCLTRLPPGNEPCPRPQADDHDKSNTPGGCARVGKYHAKRRWAGTAFAGACQARANCGM